MLQGKIKVQLQQHILGKRLREIKNPRKNRKNSTTFARIFIINNLNQTPDFATWIEKTISCFFNSEIRQKLPAG